MKPNPLLITMLLSLVLAAPLVRGAGEPNILSAEEKADGWTLLFDGKTTEGWKSFRKSDDMNRGWKVIDGALTRAQGGAGDIITEGEFGSYELVLDYNIAKGGNSGLMFHVVQEGSAPWHSGPEIQIQDNKDGHDPQKSGWLYQFYKSETDSTKPVGEWNQIRFLITPDKGGLWMNGVKYYDFVYQSDDWKELQAKSKFAGMPLFAKATKGHLCLQDHGDKVAFRNIKIREIK